MFGPVSGSRFWINRLNGFAWKSMERNRSWRPWLPAMSGSRRCRSVPKPEPVDRLSSLQLGESRSVIGISPACQGLQRRRLLDLGLVPGTEVTAVMTSPTGDPTGYRIRGAVIALRREQAELVHVQQVTSW